MERRWSSLSEKISLPSGKGFFALSAEIKVVLISLAHGVNDMYAAFLPTFVPYIKASLGLDYALTGTLSLIVGFCHIVGQPMIGFLCDRIRRPYLMIVGPLLCGSGAVMLPNAGSYGGALFCAGLWGVGSAMFHPQGSGGVGYVSKPEKLTFAMTLFNISGTAGALISPVVAVFAVQKFGYGGLWVTLLPPFLLAPLLYVSMPFLRETLPQPDRRASGFWRSFGGVFRTLLPVWGVSVIRDIVFQGVRFFLPLKVAAQGGSLETIGTVLFCITLGGTLAMIPAERIARRVSFGTILGASMVLGSLSLTAAALSSGLISTVLYIIGVSCVFSTMPLTVVLAQTLMPHARSIASSVVMGLAWGVANAALYPLGKFADWVGIHNTTLLLGLLPLLSLAFFASPLLRGRR
ncbi:MFS transporter [Fretibacterium sp. OH1220_COT-178]|nr:MFS transporter [Fretibacterium sp. OH1220_COT-178]